MTNPNDSNFPNDVPPEPSDSQPQDLPVGESTPPGSLSNTPQQSNFQQPPQYAQQIPGAEKKLAAGLCGILLGSLGIHKFILGYNTEGIIMLVVSLVGILLSCLVLPVLGSTAMWVIGIVEGIMYLTKTDQEFVDTYINGKKPWF